jgi:hypothetical protein
MPTHQNQAKAEKRSSGKVIVLERKAKPATERKKGSSPSSSAAAEKDVRRLNALLAKITSAKDGELPKCLYFDEHGLAARWGMSVKHVRAQRYSGTGPQVTYFGRSVRYRLRDVIAFEKERTFASPSDRDVRGQAAR